MKRFIIRSLLYLSPLFVTIAAVYFVDPYYLFHKERPFNEQKYEIGYSFDQGRRYKIFTYWNNPTDKIILGASEINIINERNIPEDGWHSLSYGGAPLQESLQMYWEVSKDHQLSKVIIAPEFIKYYNAISSGNGDSYYLNFSWETSQSSKAFEIYANKLDYFIDKYTLKSTFTYLFNEFYPQRSRSKPKGSKETFWSQQMDYARQVYRGGTVFFDKQKEVKKMFQDIKDDADRKGTEIIIVIPIQHVELLREEYQNGVFEIYKDYISTLTEIFGKVCYLGYTEGISESNDMFSDPFHCKSAEPYIDAIFGPSPKLFTVENIKEKLDSIRLMHN